MPLSGGGWGQREQVLMTSSQNLTGGGRCQEATQRKDASWLSTPGIITWLPSIWLLGGFAEANIKAGSGMQAGREERRMT